MSEPTRRTWIALGIAEVAFIVFSAACGLVTLAAFSAREPALERHEWWQLDDLLTLVFVAALCVAVGVPVAVHTVGRLTERVTREWSTARAGLAHLVVGLLMGAVVAGVMMRVGTFTWLGAAVAFALPAGLAAGVTRALGPFAARHAWFVTLAWVLASITIVCGILAVVGLGVRAT